MKTSLRLLARTPALLASILLGSGVCLGQHETSTTRVTTIRAPEGGIQPQAAVDDRGVIHVVAFRGDPAGGDLFYSYLKPGAERFAPSVRVNSQPGSAIAMGTIRGAQLAIAGGRVHVAWNGSTKALPTNQSGSTPMLYARSNVERSAFEPQRNLMKKSSVLDGGGSIAADDKGHVYVAWHAREDGAPEGEIGRRLYVARSANEGETFADETPALDEPLGACACCGTKSLSDDRGTLYILYRAAGEKVHRDMYLVRSDDHGKHFKAALVGPWRLDACPMSSASLASQRSGVAAAWETAGKVYFARVDPETGKISTPIEPSEGRGRKHPSVAINARGETLLAWAEGTGWQRGGALAWQVFDPQGRPTGERGRLPEGIPVWGLPAAVARPDGSFVIIH